MADRHHLQSKSYWSPSTFYTSEEVRVRGDGVGNPITFVPVSDDEPVELWELTQIGDVFKVWNVRLEAFVSVGANNTLILGQNGDFQSFAEEAISGSDSVLLRYPGQSLYWTLKATNSGLFRVFLLSLDEEHVGQEIDLLPEEPSSNRSFNEPVAAFSAESRLMENISERCEPPAPSVGNQAGTSIA